MRARRQYAPMPFMKDQRKTFSKVTLFTEINMCINECLFPLLYMRS